MFLPEISVRRPVLATVMSLVIVLLGAISFLRLTVREYPNIDAPVVSVRTVYKGASAEVVESQITNPLEDALSGIEGIKTLKSVSREEVSSITIEFVTERDVDAAANDVRDRVARSRSLLPEAADDPVVAKVEADAQAIMWLRLSSDRHNPLEITDYADRYVADALKTIPGVASVIIGGERRYAMRIWLDRERLAAYGVTVQDVEDALRRQNVEVPAGRIESRNREFTVLSATDLQTPAQFNNLIIREVNNYPVRLKDVGRAELGAYDDRNIVRVDGREAVGLGIVKQSTANLLDVANGVKAMIPRLQQTLPDGMRLNVSFDRSVFVEASIDAVYRVLAEALVLVVLVIFFFLRSLRATLIPFVTIPVSLIGAFFVIWALGFSINVLTLLGIVLAVGLVVDDAIVVLENIHRHIEEGMNRLAAAFQGAREIAFAVVAMTITLAAVFAPLAFATGNTGRLFTEFALTVAAAVLVSGFVALTLTPMMCSKLLRHQARHGRLYNALEGFFHWLARAYRSSLERSLRHRGLVVAVFLGVSGIGAALFMQLRSELAPLEDRGIFIVVLTAPEGATLEYTDRYTRDLERILKEIPEIRSFFTVVAPGLEKPNPVNNALAFVNLHDWSARRRNQLDITDELTPRLMKELPGVLAFPINPPSLGQSFRSAPVQYVIQGTSWEELERAAERMMERAQQFPGLINVDTDLKLSKPQLAVEIDRDKAAAVGVEIETIGRTLETLLGGRDVTRFKRQGEQYDVVVKLEDKDRVEPSDLTQIYVRNRNGQLIQLSNLVTVKEGVAPRELNHFNRFRAATLSARLAPGYTLGQALDFLDQAAAEELGNRFTTDLDGQSREFRESGRQLYFVFVLALAFIYLVLAAQFESFRSPFVIMLTVPLAITGAVLAMYVQSLINPRYGTLNVYTQIGLVMLIGLITKNGILIVEFANQLRDRGREKLEAVIEAASLRLRPILMTSLATTFGAVPIALATGAGAESRQAIGWVIVGGVSVGTFFTLYVIPTMYTFIVGKREILTTEELEAQVAAARGGAEAPPAHAPAGRAEGG
ncbi:efflux RND transporter permease subunit [Pelomicrobium sp. G1]|uniref:efflux RND transporter permease subunit n=1 Tax=unclassified Pelomicrobium TaxID=2815318 RepID=UPI003F75D83B